MSETLSNQTQSLDGDAEFCVAKARVVVVAGDDKGAAAEASSAELSIGTSPGNDLVLNDPTVSRHHLAIELTESGARVRDLGSTNGTRFGGRRVSDMWIQPGDSLELGRTTIEFKEPDGLLRSALSDEGAWCDVLGKSRAMRKLFAMLPTVAQSSSTVLLSGETGCGKSLIARTLHENSPRSEQPFIVVDCGAIPESLIESELFGHEQGAFTGADKPRLGAFRAANGGTLLLEEIGELGLEMQPRLLRALEERKVSPVGSDQSFDIDIRVVAATNRDLRERVNSGQFRADLFYRLNVLRLRVPPLRERPEDITLLARHFYSQLVGTNPGGSDLAEPPKSLLEAFRSRAWPGNVRELRAAVERAIVFGGVGDETSPATAMPVTLTQSFRAAKEQAMSHWETNFLRELITEHKGNVSAAARAARMDRNHLRELLLKRGIDYRGLG